MSRTNFNPQRTDEFENGFQYEKPQSFNDATDSSERAIERINQLIETTKRDLEKD